MVRNGKAELMFEAVVDLLLECQGTSVKMFFNDEITSKPNTFFRGIDKVHPPTR